MNLEALLDRLECSPIIAAVHENSFGEALDSPAEVIFYLRASLLTVADRVREAHAAGKMLFVHIDLAEGIGKDKTGVEFLSGIGVDGIISTRTQLLRYARESGLAAVQRFFALDSQGLESMEETLSSGVPHLVEIMPGVIGKVIARVAKKGVPVIAGGLIENKKEVLCAIEHGAVAVSTGNKELWHTA